MTVDVRVVKYQKDSLRGFANIVLDKAIAIHGIRVVEGKKGLFCSFPSDKSKDGKYYESVHPVTKEARLTINQAILDAYKALK